jgi:hypothetical protein
MGKRESDPRLRGDDPEGGDPQRSGRAPFTRRRSYCRHADRTRCRPQAGTRPTRRPLLLRTASREPRQSIFFTISCPKREQDTFIAPSISRSKS